MVEALQLHWPAFAGAHPELPTNGVHLWAAALQTMHIAHNRAALSEGERARARRLRNPARCAQYIAGRVGLRKLLGGYCGCAPGELRFEYGARGKPMLANVAAGESLGFNYSLSGGYALYAFARGREVGVDLEVLPRAINATRMARRKLGDAERESWRALPAALRDEAMLACWTRKEAYGKALGVGIRYHLNRAPVCAELQRAVWQCKVGGLFEGESSARVLHGVQVGLPFAGVAALVYDGEALLNPAAEIVGWRLQNEN